MNGAESLVQSLINDFMASSGLGNQVVAIVQGGAAEGNPEYQGIFGDIDFRSEARLSLTLGGRGSPFLRRGLGFSSLGVSPSCT